MRTNHGYVTMPVAPAHKLTVPVALQSALGLVSPSEVEQLRQAIADRRLPDDLVDKLFRLERGDLAMRHVAHTSLTLLEMLQAACQGEFDALSPSDFEEVLHVLAYVRKEDDAIPDFLPTGYLDDQKEVRLAEHELAAVIGRFKAWRLRRQVPLLWAGTPATV